MVLLLSCEREYLQEYFVVCGVEPPCEDECDGEDAENECGDGKPFCAVT